jgi:hypothetical protein
VVSIPIAVVANVNDAPVGTVTISGTPEQDTELTAANTLSDLDGLGSVIYQWRSNGVDRGTSPTLLLTEADIGNTITVTASYTDQGGFLETLTSAETAPVEDGNDGGLLFDAQFLLEAGGTIIAEDAQLYRIYAGMLGRTPDREGFEWWSNEIEQGNYTLTTMVDGFLDSDEFLAFFGDVEQPEDISSTDFVNHMYAFGFAREADPVGFAFWTGELDSGARSQQKVVIDMTQSKEFSGLEALPAVDFLIG